MKSSGQKVRNGFNREIKIAFSELLYEISVREREKSAKFPLTINRVSSFMITHIVHLPRILTHAFFLHQYSTSSLNRQCHAFGAAWKQEKLSSCEVTHFTERTIYRQDKLSLVINQPEIYLQSFSQITVVE